MIRAVSVSAILMVCLGVVSTGARQRAAALRVSALAPARAAELFAQYDRGDYPAVDRTLATFSGSVTNWYEFQEAAAAWVAEGSAPAQVRRRLIAATAGLEIAYVQRSSWDFTAMLIEAGCELLREDPPGAAERWWHLAAIGLAQAMGNSMFLGEPAYESSDPAVIARQRAQRNEERAVRRRQAGESAKAGRVPRIQALGSINHLQHAVERFPQEPAVGMALAVMAENALLRQEQDLIAGGALTNRPPEWIEGGPIASLLPSARRARRDLAPHLRMDAATATTLLTRIPDLPAAEWSLLLWDLAGRYRSLAAAPDQAAEAHVRLGLTYLKLARPDLALDAFREVEGLEGSAHFTYLARLRRGLILRDQGQRAEATSTLRAALAVFPRAQSATSALVPLLIEMDQREEAVVLMDAALRAPLAADPWRTHVVGDASHWSEHVGGLRRALQ